MHKKIFFTSFIKIYPCYIPFFAIISVWNPTPIIAPGGQVTASSNTFCNWKPVHPKASGRKLIILKQNDNNLIEEDIPTERHTLDKGALFDLFPMHIMNDVHGWIIELEHNDKFNIVMASIKSTCN